MNPLNDDKILESWRKNARPWTQAVRDGLIRSRVVLTDRAIIEAILERRPRTVLDIGCGEGWLVRVLDKQDIQVIGVDAVQELVEQARQAGGGDFHTLTYEALVQGGLDVRVDLAVCNFSLLGEASVTDLFRGLPNLLNKRGILVVQTLHPLTACGEGLYRDGWREGSWEGFSADFSDPAPWYFRTLESWVRVIAESGFRLLEMREPVSPETGLPGSVIFVAEAPDSEHWNPWPG